MSSPMNDSFETDDIIEAEHILQIFGPLGDLEEGQAFFREDIGSANAYKVDFSGSGANKNEISAYKEGQLIIFKASNANTAASTLQVAGPSGDLSAVPLTKSGNAALVAGDIQAGQMVAVVYNDAGRFEMVGAPSQGSLEGLSDVNFSSPTTGQVVQFDGSDWVNADFGAAEIPSGIDAAKIGAGDVSNAEFGYLDGVTGAIQTQLDGKAASSHNHAAADINSGQIALARGGTGADLSATGGTGQVLKQNSSGGAVSVGALAASEMPSGIDAAKIGSGDVSNTEFGYLDGVTSALQTQLDGKAASSHNHAASDINSGQIALARGGTGADLSATGGTGQVLKQSSSGGAVSVGALAASEMPGGIDAAKIGSGSVSNAEFGYLDGVTSSVQTQLNGKAASSHNHAASDINSGQIALARGGTGADLSATGGTGQVLKQSSSGGAVSVGALAASEMPGGIDASKIGSGSVSNAEFGYLDGVTSSVQTQLNGKAASSHNHAASDINSGQIALARGGTGADLSATGGTGQVLKQSSSGGAVSVGALAASEMPGGIDAAKIGSGSVSDAEFGYLNGVTSSVQTQLDGKAASSHNHAASHIDSGQIALARGGTGADLSATGGTGQVLKQNSSGGAVSVGALAASEMPNGIDAAKIGSGDVSNTEFGYLDGVTGPLQSQLNVPYVFSERVGDQAVNHGSFTTVVLNNKIEDPDNMTNTSSGVVTLNKAGVWCISATIRTGTNDTGPGFPFITMQIQQFLSPSWVNIWGGDVSGHGMALGDHVISKTVLLAGVTAGRQLRIRARVNQNGWNSRWVGTGTSLCAVWLRG